MAKTADVQAYQRTHVAEPLAKLAAIRKEAQDHMFAKPSGTKVEAVQVEPKPLKGFRLARSG